MLTNITHQDFVAVVALDEGEEGLMSVEPGLCSVTDERMMAGMIVLVVAGMVAGMIVVVVAGVEGHINHP